MTQIDVKEAVKQAKLFVRRAEAALEEAKFCEVDEDMVPGRQQAAMRRTSIELTLALATMRRPKRWENGKWV